jgi:hypothetical protein
LELFCNWCTDKTVDCTRENLKGFIDKYFASIQAHDISGLPLATDVKFTENGVNLPQAGFLADRR